MILDEEQIDEKRKLEIQKVSKLSAQYKYAFNSKEGAAVLGDLKEHLGIGLQMPSNDLGPEKMARIIQAYDIWNYIQLMLDREES